VREKKKLEARKQIRDDERVKNRQLAKEGKKPEFMSKREMKNKELVSTFEELKKKGKLDKYLKKKNKRNLSRDKKSMLRDKQ
jgi:ribosomal RNA-processing protein 36